MDAPESPLDPFPGEYRFDRKIGGGGFGAVWAAFDLSLRVPVAVKTIRVPPDSPFAAEQLAALRNDATLLARVRHPNVVRVMALREAAGAHYLIMELVPDGSLADRLRSQGPLPWAAAARYAADVADALAALHAMGVVHRDVKPANVLWDAAADEARLTDLGVSIRLADAASRRELAGSLAYMAPEAFHGETSSALDVYSLAVALFELMAGAECWPFPPSRHGGHIFLVRQGLSADDPRFAGVPESIERLIRAGLAFDPAARPPMNGFAAELRGALNRLLADTLARPVGGSPGGGLELTVSRLGPDGADVLATTLPAPPPLVTRDVERVPPSPTRLVLRTGDRVRVRVRVARDGYLTVFNIGPTGNLNPLLPRDPAVPRPVRAGEVVNPLQAALTPPPGLERVFAVWSRLPLSLPPADLRALVERFEGKPPPGYRATRDLELVQTTVQHLAPGDWEAVGVELDHRAVSCDSDGTPPPHP